MEREIMLTGIGGQGVQLAARVMADAAVREGRHALLFGSYGGTMRGGQTDSTLVVGDAPVTAPPIVAKTWGALAMHHAWWEPLRRKLRPGGVVVVNASLFEGELDRSVQRVFDVDATALASGLGSPMAASMVLLGAFVAVTELLAVDSLVAAMRDALPSYRREHAELNERALRAGSAALPAGACPAWKTEDAA